MSKVFTFTEASSIALHGMILIARANEKINVLKISERLKASRHHVAKVFQRLVKDNLLESQRGPKGGFMLKRPPEEITLLDIYQSIEGDLEIHTCPMESNICPFDDCMFGDVGENMTRVFRDYLINNSLDKFIPENNK